VFLNGIGGSRKGEKIYKMNQAKNEEDRFKCGQSMNLGALRSKIRCETYSRTKYGNLFRRKDLSSGLTRGFSNMAMPLLMMH
jgi:hypothetical protein